jgi:hypothetical protein
MRYLLELEWKKFKHYRTFKVMAILFLILLPSTVFVAKAFFINAGAPPEFVNTDSMTKFPSIWRYLAYGGNWVAFFFLGFIGVISITMEFSNKTLRQNIINGITRNEFFLGKLLFILAVSLLATLYFALSGFLIGAIYTDTLYYTKLIAETSYIPRFFLLCLGYMSFGFFLGVLIRRTGLALFIYLVYIIFLEPAIRWALHYKFFPNKSIHFYPLNAIEDLAPIPVLDIVDKLTKENDFSLLLSTTETVITSIVFIGIFIFVAHRRILRSDL